MDQAEGTRAQPKETAKEWHERFMREHNARMRKVDEAIEADQRAWAQLVQAVAELQARRGFWSRVFGLR